MKNTITSLIHKAFSAERIEELTQALKRDDAVLFQSQDGQGIMIVQPEITDNRLGFFISLAASTSNNHKHNYNWEFIRQLARESQCDYIAYKTKRRGLIKLGLKHGYKISDTPDADGYWRCEYQLTVTD